MSVNLIDWVGIRAAGKALIEPQFTPTTWAVNTVKALWALSKPTVANGHYYRAIVAGTTHGTIQPTWPTTDEGTVADNTITWREELPCYVVLSQTKDKTKYPEILIKPIVHDERIVAFNNVPGCEGTILRIEIRTHRNAGGGSYTQDQVERQAYRILAQVEYVVRNNPVFTPGFGAIFVKAHVRRAEPIEPPTSGYALSMDWQLDIVADNI